MDQECGRINPARIREGGANAASASQVQRAVERVDGNPDLGRPVFIRVRAQFVADHLLGSLPKATVPLHGRGPGHVAGRRVRACRDDNGRIGMVRSVAEKTR